MNIFKSFDLNSTTLTKIENFDEKIFAYSCRFVFVEFHESNPHILLGKEEFYH
jgi:hypothetical protein